MINMRPIAVTFLAGLMLIAPTAAANEIVEKQKDVDAILDDAVRAVAAESRIKEIESIHAYAECLGPKGEYTTRIASFDSDKVFIQRTFGDREKPSNIKINGAYGWNTDSDPFSPEIISPFEKMVNRLHEFQRMAFDFRTMFTDFELVGAEDFFGSPSFKVRAKSEIGWPANLYFSKRARTLSGYDLLNPDGTKVTNRFDEWRKIDGINLPVKITAIDPQGEWILNFKTIEFNSVRENVFDVPRPVKDMAELLRLQKQSEEAHLTKDATLLVASFDSAGIVQLSNGETSRITPEAGLNMFSSYFSRVKFDEWADIESPKIRISKDGTMASIIVRKRVRSTVPDDLGKKISRHMVFSWLEVWEKDVSDWKLMALASTDKTVERKIDGLSAREADLAELVRLHKQAQTAHLTYDAKLFVEMFAENLTQIQSGRVVSRDKKANLERFHQYFGSYKFDEWEDIVPPIIKISQDGTLATVTVQKRVSGKYKDDKGVERTDKTVFAWLEVWEKINGEWKVVTVASTSKTGN